MGTHLWFWSTPGTVAPYEHGQPPANQQESNYFMHEPVALVTEVFGSFCTVFLWPYNCVACGYHKACAWGCQQP